MKRTNLLKRLKEVCFLAIVACLMSSCFTTSGYYSHRHERTNRIEHIEKGMTRQEVSRLLGMPDERFHNKNKEQWTYYASANKRRATVIQFHRNRVTRVTNRDGYLR